MKFLFEFIADSSIVIEASDVHEALDTLISLESVSDKMLLEKILTIKEVSLKEKIKLTNRFLAGKTIINVYEINRMVFDWDKRNEMEYSLVENELR